MKISAWFLAILLICVLEVEAKDQEDSKSDLVYVAPSGMTCVKCSAGTYLKSHCVIENTTSRCQLCPKGTFSSKTNTANDCYPCKKYCETDQLVPFSNCSSTSDLKCECPEGTFNLFPSLEKHQAVCQEFGLCTPGNGVLAKGTSVKNTTCVRCIFGKTFSSTTSAFDECQQCTDCGQHDILSDCTLTHDRKCKTIKPSDHQTGSSADASTFLLEVVLPVSLAIGVAAVIVVILLMWYFRNYFCQVKEDQEKSQPCPTNNETCDMSNISSQNHHLETHDDVAQQTVVLLPVPSLNDTPSLPLTLHLPSTSALQLSQTSTNIWGSSLTSISQKVVNGLITDGSWKFFIRDLYQVSNDTINADSKIQEVQSNDRNDVKEQIYQCLMYICERGATPEKVIETLQQRECHSLVATLRKDFPDVFHSCEIEV